MRYTNRFLSGRRALAVAAAGAMTLTLVPGMASADLHEDVCSDESGEEFPDVEETDFWEDEIECIAGYGIVDGFTDGEYKAGRNVKRGEMAKYMAATYEVATDSTIEASQDYFDDDDGHPLEEWINKAAEIDVVEGDLSGDYNPNRDVPRSEMAAYVSRMIEAVTGEDIDEGDTDHFDDDNASGFEAEINELASIGVVEGTSPDPDTYEPTRDVFRGEMAGFTARAAGYLDSLGLWAPTAPAEDDGTGINNLENLSEDAPELINVETEVSGDDEVVAFQFDESVSGQALDYTATDETSPRQYYMFRIYSPSGDVEYPYEARIEGDTVLARFAGSTVTPQNASLATVRYDAVEDAEGIPNIEGEYALLPPETTAEATAFAPQLVEVGNYRLAGVIGDIGQQVLVDYTFNTDNAAAWLGLSSANQFRLVGNFAADYPGTVLPSGTADADPTDGQTVITVRFAEDPTELPESQLARGYVMANAAGSTDPDATDDTDMTIANNLTLADNYESVPDETDTPDLDQVEQTSDTTFRYEFDESVSDTNLDASGFWLYNNAGQTWSADIVERSADADDDAAVMVATFNNLPEEVENTPVGAFVDDSAVRATDSTDDENEGFNRPDEVVLTLPAAETDQPPAGVTALPDLESITRDQNVVTENYSVTYTFDQELPNGDVGNVDFDLYDENGTQFRANVVCADDGVACGTNSITFSIDDGFDEAGFGNEQIAAAVTGGVQDADDAPETGGLSGDPAEAVDIFVTEAQTDIDDA